MNIEHEILITSLALGELEGEEKAQAEALVANDVRAKAYFEEMKSLGETLKVELAAETVPGLDATRREVIEKVTAGSSARGGMFTDLRPFAVVFSSPQHG